MSLTIVQDAILSQRSRPASQRETQMPRSTEQHAAKRCQSDYQPTLLQTTARVCESFQHIELFCTREATTNCLHVCSAVCDDGSESRLHPPHLCRGWVSAAAGRHSRGLSAGRYPLRCRRHGPARLKNSRHPSSLVRRGVGEGVFTESTGSTQRERRSQCAAPW